MKWLKNTTKHVTRTIKIKPGNVQSGTYIDYGVKHDKILNLKVGDHVRISKHKNSFAKGHTPNWSEEVFAIKKVKNTLP